jgi:ribonuclease HI
MTEVTIFTDGASRGNPGPGGYGAVVMASGQDGTIHKRELSQGYIETTNNRMELMGPIMALRVLNRPCKVELYSDSKYLVDAFNKHWIENWMKKGWKKSDGKAVKNIDLWKALIAEVEKHDIAFNWVKGHVDTKNTTRDKMMYDLNNRCDELATTAADGDLRIPDVELK